MTRQFTTVMPDGRIKVETREIDYTRPHGSILVAVEYHEPPQFVREHRNEVDRFIRTGHIKPRRVLL